MEAMQEWYGTGNGSVLCKEMICDFTEGFHGGISFCWTVQQVREGIHFKMFSSFYGMIPILC
jgi:hypothetical protein